MRSKHIVLSALTLTAVLVSSVLLSACTDGTPVKTDIPKIGRSAPQNSPVEIVNGTPEQQPVEAGGDHQNGLVTSDRKAYYYQDGVLQKGIVGNGADGFYYADADGVIDLGYVDGVIVDGESWIVSEGKATKAETAADQALFQAAKFVGKVTTPDMTHEQKLRACFDHIKTDYLEGVLEDPDYFTTEWPVTYANDFFTTGRGDCFSFGASYAFMAKAIGYAEVYALNSGGHGWAEVDGKYYDPEWDKHHVEFDHYAMNPTDQLDIEYLEGIGAGYDWMRVKL